MRLVVVGGIDPDIVREVVGAGTYATGVTYARQRAVAYLEWDEVAVALDAVVRGADGRQYEVTAYFERSGNELALIFGECTCPVGECCPHVVAAVLTACGTDDPGRGAAPRRAGSWERDLGALLTPAAAEAARAGDSDVVGIELSLSLPPGARGTTAQLLARPVRPGKSGWWVAGGLSWSRLESTYAFGEVRPSHLRLLRELYALHRSGAGLPRYYHGDDRTIDLAEFDSPLLWSFLDEAAALGLPIVHTHKRLGAVERPGRAELCLDVTAGGEQGSLVVTPVLHVDDDPGGTEAPLLFLGASGHGVVHAPRALLEPGAPPGPLRFRLAKLAAPVPAALQRMALQAQPLAVPAGQHERFGSEFYPRLRHLAPVVSTDGRSRRRRSPGPPSCCRAPTATTTSSASPGSGRTTWVGRRSGCRCRPPTAPASATRPPNGPCSTASTCRPSCAPTAPGRSWLRTPA